MLPENGKNEQNDAPGQNTPFPGPVATPHFCSLSRLTSRNTSGGTIWGGPLQKGWVFFSDALAFLIDSYTARQGSPLPTSRWGSRPKSRCPGRCRRRTWPGGRRRQAAQSRRLRADRATKDGFVLPALMVQPLPSAHPLRGLGEN